MSVVQNQEVEAGAQADVAATPVDATVQAETLAPAAETPETLVPVAETPAPVATPEVKVETPKKRTTTSKAAKAAETPAAADAPAPAAETPAAVQAETPAPATETKPADEAPAAALADAPAPATETKLEDEAPAAENPPPVKPLANGFAWGSKRKEKKAQESADQSCEVEVTNTGTHSFEAYTRTPLPTNKTVVITCESPRQRAAVVSKLNKLNQLAGVNRYITLVK